MNIWRYVAIATLGICGGLLTGQYTPNRNLITKADLEPIVQSQQAMDVRLRSVEDKMSELIGEQKERDAQAKGDPR